MHRECASVAEMPNESSEDDEKDGGEFFFSRCLWAVGMWRVNFYS